MNRWSALMTVLIIATGLASCGGTDVEPPYATAATRTYSTRFPRAENPIAEDGNWINGAAVGLDWGDVATRPGLAYGLQNGRVRYADGTAILSGSWGPEQTVEATVHVGAAAVGDNPEVELRLRSSLSAHLCTGYEVQWGVAGDNPYFTIVRWNGPLGSFQRLYRGDGSRFAVGDGDVIMATMFGNTIRAYVGGQLIAEVADDTYASGNPGLGFNYYCREECLGPHDGYGLTAFSASGAPAQTLSPDADPLESHGRR